MKLKPRNSVRIGIAIFGLVSGVVLLIAAIGIRTSAIWFPIVLIAVSILSLALAYKFSKKQKTQAQNDFEL